MTGGGGDKRDRPAWLGTPAADTIFTVARNRVYRQKMILPPPPPEGKGKERAVSVDGFEIPDDLGDDDWYGAGPSAEEEEMLREIEEAEAKRVAALAAGEGEGSKDAAAMPPPPAPVPKVLPPQRKRSRWQPPGVEAVLEEQPKWLLLADVLDEIETQMHWADHDPCTSLTFASRLLLSLIFLPYSTRINTDGESKDTILVMCNSSDTCLTLGNYLSSLSPSSSLLSTGIDGGDKSKEFLESKLKSYFFWKAHMGKLQKSLKRTPGFNKGERRSSSTSTTNGASSSSAAGTAGAFASSSKGKSASTSGEGEMSAALKRKDWQRGTAPSTKRRRIRGGGAAGSNGSAGHAAVGGAGAGQGMFAAATGANPEALEEDAQKMAERCVFPSSSSLFMPPSLTLHSL
jgi:DNA excision repair protein ERCC-4